MGYDKNNKIFNIGLLLGSLLLCFWTSEIVLAALHLPRFYNAHSAPPQFQPFWEGADSYYLNLPSSNIRFVYDGNPRGYFGTGNEIDHHTNARGFRGNEFQFEKPPHVFRMAFLGDSFTFGEGVKFEDTYPEKTSALLRKKYGHNIVFESYNFGVGGYNTAQELFLLKKIALNTHPDIIVLGYVLNDAEPELFSFDPAAQSWKRRPRERWISEGVPDQRPPKTFLFRSRLLQLVWQVISQRKRSQQTENYYQQLYEPHNPGWNITQASLQELIGLCESQRTHCYIVCFPLLYKLNAGYPFKNIHHVLRSEIRPETHPSIHFIDLLPYLEGKKDTDLWVHPTDQHPNEIVHAIAAQALADSISKTPGIFHQRDLSK